MTDNRQCLADLGWGRAALARYDCLCEEGEADQLFEEACLFASPAFCQLFEADWLAGQSARGLLSLAMRLLEMPDDLTSPIQLEALLTRCWPDTSPHDRFWALFAQVVAQAFPADTLSQPSDFLARQLHQARYLFSTQQTLWIRRFFWGNGQSDRQALLAYLATADRRDTVLENLGLESYEVAISYQLTESSRLHNKRGWLKEASIDVLLFPDRRSQLNLKILVNFHSEFILTQDGRLANLFDPLGSDENGLVNGASFNYASRHGQRHRELDIQPVGPHDPSCRKALLRDRGLTYRSATLTLWPFGKKWASSFYNPRGYYAQSGKSLAGQLRVMRRRFKRDLRAEVKKLREKSHRGLAFFKKM